MPSPSLDPFGQVLLAILVTLAAYFDVRHRRIPNVLVTCGLVVGLVRNSWIGHVSGFGWSAAGLALGFFLYLALYLLRARGAGDVKLLAAIGAITGPANVFWIFVLTALAGGVLGLALILVKRRMGQTLRNIGIILQDIAHMKAPYANRPELDVTSGQSLRLPHAAAVAAGTLIFLAYVQQ